MNINKTLLSLLCSIVIICNINAQVEKVGYGIKYNPSSKNFDCYLKIEKGQTSLTRDRIQFNAQLSLIVPSGSTLTMQESFMPIVDNRDFKGTKAMRWNIANSVKDISDLKADIFSLTPSLTPTAFYNDLKEGDEVKLFSVKVSPLPACAEGVRLFDNRNDPMSSDRSMGGGDFRNGFTIGNANQKYADNVYYENPLLPIGELVASTSVFVNDKISLFAGNWKNASSYSWEGPNGFRSNEINPVIAKANFNNAGKYTLTVANDQGCTLSKSTIVNINSVEDLSKDENYTSVIDSKIVLQTKVSSKIFPNPATNFINLSVQAKKGAIVSASIFNLDGKIVMANVVNQKMDTYQLDKNISLKLTSGVYTVKVTIDGESTEHRFICIE